MARAYNSLAAHLPRRQWPQRGDPAPPDPCHPPLGDSVDPPADRLPDPHATAAPADPRPSRQPAFELRPWPQHRPARCRSAEIAVRRRPSRSIDVSHVLKNSSAGGGGRGTRNEGVRDEGRGSQERGTRESVNGRRTFSLAQQGRVSDIRVARVAILWGENGYSKSPHESPPLIRVVCAFATQS